MANADCIFCKIIAGEIPCTKIYEDDNVIAFLDINPVNKGHTLVIPKEHYENMQDIPEDLLCNVIKIVKKLTPNIINAVNAPAFNVIQSNGKVAGQEVSHIHFHIIPRLKDDNLKLSWPTKKYTEGEAEKIAEQIKKLYKQQ